MVAQRPLSNLAGSTQQRYSLGIVWKWRKGLKPSASYSHIVEGYILYKLPKAVPWHAKRGKLEETAEPRSGTRVRSNSWHICTFHHFTKPFDSRSASAISRFLTVKLMNLIYNERDLLPFWNRRCPNQAGLRHEKQSQQHFSWSHRHFRSAAPK